VVSIKSGLTVALTLIVIIAIVVVAIFVSTPTTSTAPDFEITDIDNQIINLSSLRGKVVVLDFFSIDCEGCKLITKNLREIIPLHGGDLKVISVDILPLYDTVPELIVYRDMEGITWQIAQDADNLAGNYGVGTTLPHVIIVDRKGVVTWNWVASGPLDPGANKADMEREISKALAGTAIPTSIAQASVFSLTILAALGSFFSPCSFPLLPGYMAYYLGIDSQSKTKPSTKTAASRGFVTAIGIILIYGIIAAIVFLAASAASAFVPFLGPIVGVILIFLGILTLTPLQYHKLVEPFHRLREKIFPSKTGAEKQPSVGIKMFAYGVGYGAAGFACVAPPFIAAVINASIYGNWMYGVLVVVIYSVIVIALMVAITIMLSEAGQAAVKKMNRYVNVIKKISGVALIIAGAYLLYFWYISQ